MLTKKEYADLATRMQDIYKNKRDIAESIAFQLLLNGDKKSIEEAKQRVQEYEKMKIAIDQCITALQYFTDWNSDAKTDKKTDYKTN